MYFVTASFARAVVFLGTRNDGAGRRQPAIALLFKFQRGMRARQLALEEHHFVLPRQRHEVHVAQAPGVVVPADSRRAVLRGRLAVRASARSPSSRAAPPAIARLKLGVPSVDVFAFERRQVDVLLL